MTSKPGQFRVDPRLARLLGENYRSTEQAIKELIWNGCCKRPTLSRKNA
jgi:hypothetical protein